MEEIKIKLSDPDVRYGIIKINKENKKFFDFKKGKQVDITLKLGETMYKTIIPSHGSYISRLTKIHRENGAKEGTFVEIKKVGNEYELKYTSSTSSDVYENNSIETLIEDIKILVSENTWAFYKNETNVRTEIVDKVLACLGWYFPETIFREPNTKNGGNADYALQKDEEFQVIIETKSLDKNLDEDCRNQLTDNYMTCARFSQCIGILTNGMQWDLFWEDKVYQTNVFNTGQFKEVLQLLKFKDFDKEKIIKKIKNSKGYSLIPPLQINYNGNYTEFFMKFIEDHADEVSKLEESGFFNVRVISTEQSYFHKRPSRQIGKYYVTTDYSTLCKAMLIQQLLQILNLSNELNIDVINPVIKGSQK